MVGIAFFYSYPITWSQEIDGSESCMECHGEDDLIGEIENVETSMFIPLIDSNNSIHSDFSCIDCHSDIEEFPHDEELQKVNCYECHEEIEEELSVSVHHVELGLGCSNCHGDPHNILPTEDEESLTHHGNIVKQCSNCHGEDKQATTTGNPKENATTFMNTVHGQALMSGNSSAADCVDCHGAHNIQRSHHEDSLVNHYNITKTCSKCHQEINDIFNQSVHGQAMQEGYPDSPCCTTCHGEHSISKVHSEDSQMEQDGVYYVCGQCHFDVTIMDKYNLASAEQETLFKGSVHAEEVMKNNPNAPTCVNCHGFHNVIPLRDPDSPSNFMNVPETCGKCHVDILKLYSESVHGKSAQQGHKDSPVCTDCHGEHAVLRIDDEQSPVSQFNLSSNTCGRCHSSIVINDKYGIDSDKVENYFNSYHGFALQHKSKTAANCGSCHGNHLILPSSDPRSTISQERLTETCGQCHPGISTNVLAAPIHSDFTLRSDLIAAWVPRIYLVLIVLMIGGMLFHNGIILFVLLKEKYRKESCSPSYNRFTRFEIILHILLTVSFVMLAVTGFALVNPKSWWVTFLSYFYMDESVRSLIHRIAGVLLITISFIYAGYMILISRGRSEFMAFFPKWSDFVHPFQNLAYYLGKRRDAPEFDRYDYTEKLEFWALVWGIIIMAVTGLMLWFPILSLQYLPKWAFDIAELVHYYEAVLATLAIVVWHLFFVMFHPEEYPMSTTWLSGKMSMKELKHRHPLEYERLMNEQKQESKEDDTK